jgi:predicted nucleic acid-binding protein
MPDRVYWDSCLFIEVVQKSNPERLDECSHMITRAKNHEIEIATSTLTIVEVNRIHGVGRLPAEDSKQILELFENDYFFFRQLDRPVAEFAHRLVGEHPLSNNDAIHVATALMVKASVLYTYDSKKPKRRGLLAYNRKIGDPPLRIELPPKPDFGPLYEKGYMESK